MAVEHEAADSFLGYLYQLRFGLLRALRTKSPSAMLAFEFLDDVQLVDDAVAAGQQCIVGLHQLKHSVGKKASLGPKSSAVWKTLGNWATLIATDLIGPEDTLFFLHTTGEASTQSPLSHLRDDEHRDPEDARKALIAAGKSTADAGVSKQFAKLEKINTKQQCLMFENMYLSDSETDIAGLRTDLEAELSVACHPAHLTSHVRQLEGWLFDVAIGSLLPGGRRTITVSSIKAESARIRDMYVAESLPDEFSESPVPDKEVSVEDDRVFVQQLILVGVKQKRITTAQQDHYRAFAQRSQWSRDGLVAIEELPRFDRSLIDEWRRRHEVMCESSDRHNTDSEISAGSKLFEWAELEAPNLTHLQLRAAFNAPFLVRGSYHVLADRLKVGWHPRFVELLNSSMSEKE